MHRTGLRVRCTEFLQDSQSTLGVSVGEGAEDKHIDCLAARNGRQTRGAQVRTDDLKIGIALKPWTVIGYETVNCRQRVRELYECCWLLSRSIATPISPVYTI